jgi:hypothetical protein
MTFSSLVSSTCHEGVMASMRGQAQGAGIPAKTNRCNWKQG